MTPDGAPAPGNPFGTYVYSYGHRNVQGLAWDTQGRMYATEFGQNTFDEINLIQPGVNYGWPTCEGVCNNSAFRNPIVTWTTAEASPSGLAFANNTLFVGALAGRRLWTVPLNNGAPGTPVAELQNAFGRLRAVTVGPDGWLWITTSNRDGRGTPVTGDDRIVRVPPATTGGDTTPPSAPANLAASGTTSTSTNLSWTASTDNVGVTGYDIMRAPGASGGTFAVVGTSATTSFSNTGLTANTTYRYQVQARDAAGNVSPVSNTVQVTTSGGITTGACSATPTVQTQWGTGYVIQPVTVTNTSTSTITSWTVTFTLPAGHALTGSWNATVTTSGQIVTAKSVGFNGTLAPGASTTTFGFQASRPNGNTALPSGFTCTTP
jgi:chitodextrinase